MIVRQIVHFRCDCWRLMLEPCPLAALSPSCCSLGAAHLALLTWCCSLGASLAARQQLLASSQPAVSPIQRPPIGGQTGPARTPIWSRLAAPGRLQFVLSTAICWQCSQSSSQLLFTSILNQPNWPLSWPVGSSVCASVPIGSRVAGADRAPTARLVVANRRQSSVASRRQLPVASRRAATSGGSVGATISKTKSRIIFIEHWAAGECCRASQTILHSFGQGWKTHTKGQLVSTDCTEQWALSTERTDEARSLHTVHCLNLCTVHNLRRVRPTNKHHRHSSALFSSISTIFAHYFRHRLGPPSSPLALFITLYHCQLLAISLHCSPLLTTARHCSPLLDRPNCGRPTRASALGDHCSSRPHFSTTPLPMAIADRGTPTRAASAQVLASKAAPTSFSGTPSAEIDATASVWVCLAELNRGSSGRGAAKQWQS